MKRHAAISIALLATALAVPVAPVVIAGQQDARHVIIISIDGLKPETYTDSGPSKVPTLRRIGQDGAFATAVLGVTPTVTYPSHTTVVTGVPPTVHGIYNNRILDPEEISNASWYWYARDIKVPTLYGAVKAKGLKTAAVSWPVTVDADIDYLMPEFGGVTRHPRWLDLMRALSKPRNLLDDYEAQGTPLSWPMTDADRTGLAAWIFRTYRPNLLLLHIFATDDAQHAFGPGTPEALAAIEGADGRVQQMIQAVADAGLQDRTDLVVLSDHGFLPIEQQLQPNFVFKREGLLEVDDAGKVARWDAYFYSAGGSGFVLLRNPQDRVLRERVAALLQTLASDPANGIRTVWNQEQLREMAAEPRASFGLDMNAHFYTAAGHDVLMKKSASRGGHGFAPSRAELHASLLMRGPDIPRVGSLGMIRMSQIGPTVASWFGVALSPSADVPLALSPGQPRAPF